MPLWGKQKPPTHTNAPRHWPRIELDRFDAPGPNLLLIAAQLAPLAQGPGASMAFLRDFVYDDGILRVPLLVREGGQTTAVFTYSSHDPSAASHYSAVRAVLRVREQVQAVYYGPEALSPVKPGVALQPIDTPFFSKPSAEEKDAAYALWWATAEASNLAGSQELISLDRWFEAMDGYGYLLLTAFLKDLELVEEATGVYAVPAQAFLQPMVGPGDTRMLLHASAAEGVFLAFHQATPPGRRRVLLQLLADFATDYRKAIEAKKLAPHADEHGHGLARWRQIRDAALAREAEGGAGLTLHAVTYVAGQPTRSPHATTADERAAQLPPPGTEELDFGMELVDRVVERLKDARATGSTQAELGAPNFVPVIAVRVGPDVFERRVPYEGAEEVQAAAARALDEWPGADVVAVLVDGAIREDAGRIDVFDLKVQNRAAGRAGALFQRYRVTGDGHIELIGNPTAMPAPLFLVERDAAAEPQPDPGLAALARQAIDAIVASLSVPGPSGEDDDAEDTLFSPSALTGTAAAPRPRLSRFVMQGPITAALTCHEMVAKELVDWIVFHIDDLVWKNGVPDRRLRLCVQRKQDPALAIFDQHFEAPGQGRPLSLRGDLTFRRWSGSMFPPPAAH